MTKKDNATSSSSPNDFFSDISDDLQMQVERLSGGSSSPTEDHAFDDKEEQPSALFSVPESESNATFEDDAALFDKEPSASPPTDTSLTGAVPYPAALSDVALEATNPNHTRVEPSATSVDLPFAEVNPAHPLDAPQDNATIQMDTIEFGEHIVNPASHEPTNADDTKTMADQSPQADQRETTPSDDAANPEVVADTTQASTAAPTDAEAAQEVAADAPAATSVSAQEATPTEASATDTQQAQDTDGTSADAAEERAATSSTEAEAEEAAEAEAASAAQPPGEPDEDSSENPTSAPDESADAMAGVKVQQGQRSNREPLHLEQKPFRSSAPETTLVCQDETLVLVEALEHSPDRVIWLARREGDDDAPEIQINEISTARYRSGYQHFPEIPGLHFHRPTHVVEEEERAFLIYNQPEGTPLYTQLRSPDHHWTIGQLRRFMRSLAENVHAIHKAGFLLLELNDQHIWLGDQRTPLLFDLERLYTERTPFHLRPICEGYSAPELYHQQPIGPHTDVFAMGTLLHYMISQCPAFNHLDLPNPNIPSPRIYQLDFPVGLDHVIEQATHIEANQRYPNIPTFMQALERAFHEIEDRHRQEHTPLQISVGHDIHIGINKGMRNPVNQDALFWRYDRRRHKGLFLVADGVSHCHYGSGDRASSILIQAARQCWDALMENPIMEQPTDHKQRRQILNTIFEAANKAIAAEVNELYEQVEGYVEDVMGSTCVGGFLDGNQLTVTNLGDSRAYLKTEHYIEQINVDHDYKTAQLQIGQDLRSLQSLMGGSLITRCVGSCRKDEQMKVTPLQLQADFFDLTLIPGDIILFCSDGLTDYAGENEDEAREMMSKIVDVHTEPRSACFWLIALANQRGGGDNISVIELKVLNTL